MLYLLLIFVFVILLALIPVINTENFLIYLKKSLSFIKKSLSFIFRYTIKAVYWILIIVIAEVIVLLLMEYASKKYSGRTSEWYWKEYWYGKQK